MEKRFILTHGFTRLRWIFLAIGIFIFLGIFNPDSNILLNIVLLMICGLFYFLLWNARKMRFDSTYLYIIKGKQEKAVPLRNIKSMKRSKAKVNSRRFWILEYEDEGVQQRKCRFFPYTFQDNSKEFKAAIKNVNPDVVIWEHPFFNH